MKPTVTREDIERDQWRSIKALKDDALRLLTERDEAIREVERLRSQFAYSTKEWNDKQDEVRRLYIESLKVKSLEEALSEEKRRTAAFREVAIGWAKLHLDEQAEKEVDAEAQKLLADSGGEKGA